VIQNPYEGFTEKHDHGPRLDAENKIVLQTISARLEWLQRSLGSEWPAFRAQLQQALERLNAASTDEQVLAAVDEIITTCLDTPAELVLTVGVERDSWDGSIDFRFLDRTRGNAELAYYDTCLQQGSGVSPGGSDLS